MKEKENAFTRKAAQIDLRNPEETAEIPTRRCETCDRRDRRNGDRLKGDATRQVCDAGKPKTIFEGGNRR